MKVIERIVESVGEPGSHDMWLKTENKGGEVSANLFVHVNGKWTQVAQQIPLHIEIDQDFALEEYAEWLNEDIFNLLKEKYKNGTLEDVIFLDAYGSFSKVIAANVYEGELSAAYIVAGGRLIALELDS